MVHILADKDPQISFGKRFPSTEDDQISSVDFGNSQTNTSTGEWWATGNTAHSVLLLLSQHMKGKQ